MLSSETNDFKIFLENVGKRFNRHWIFRHINYEFKKGNAYAITGPNGSGKSTLLQVIAGALTHSEGSIHFTQNYSSIPIDKQYEQIAVCTPYLELIEELTLKEFFDFHVQFKPLLSGIDIKYIAEYIGLKDAYNKQIRYFSSGMKQRVKLAQAVFSNVSAILLDEPTNNLDTAGIDLYYQLIDNYCLERLLIICSNSDYEISFCKEKLDVLNFKKVI